MATKPILIIAFVSGQTYWLAGPHKRQMDGMFYRRKYIMAYVENVRLSQFKRFLLK